ncbi:hypothetical protein [Kitasatospora purpeofusca]|uniref:PLL-like beta propeller domain-containing protein n=1 Tax=Kitasatospora purpeofusca TaxID=67352 RepID=A0ABZ1TRA3_9ACTN|nr:hypothetical protein [Kitasatospora purpeofusca]
MPLKKSSARMVGVIVAACAASTALACVPAHADSVLSTYIAASSTGSLGNHAAPGGKVTRSQALVRAQAWVNQSVPYSTNGLTAPYSWWSDSQTGGRYRQDCSGFVSMAWELTESPSTLGLPSYSTAINKYDLQPGDILNSSEHVVLFAGWRDKGAGTFNYYQESSRSKPTNYNTDGNLNASSLSSHAMSSYTAYRYKNIVDDVITPDPQPQGPTGRPNTVVDPVTGHLITYVRDSNNHLWSVDPQGPGWVDFGAYAASDPVTVVNPANNHLVTYVNGPDNRLWSVDPQGPGWIKFDATLSGTVMAPNAVPSTVVDPATGHLVTFIRDTNNHLWSVDPQGPGWVDFGLYAAGDPVTVVNPANNHLVTYINGPDNRLWSVDPQGPGWIKFDATLSGTVMAPNAVPSTVVDPATGHLITYIRDTSNHLWSVDPQGAGWVDFGLYAAGDPMTVVDPANNHLVTYVNGPDNRLWSVDPQGPGWIKFDATLSGTALAGNPYTVVNPANNHLITYARDTNNHMWSVDPQGPGWTKFIGGPTTVTS